MESDYILFKSNNSNNYFYSFNNNQILLSHPIMFFFLNLNKNGINIHDWIKKSVKNKFEIENIDTFSKKEILYYYEKFKFLLNNNYIKEKNINNTYKYDEDDIKYHIANASQISFEVTDRCNLACEYCIYGKYYTNRNKPQNIDLSTDTAKNVLNYLVEFWNSSLNSSHKKNISIGFYGGEPLLNINFIYEIVNYVKTLPNKHVNFLFDMTTNGVLIDKYISYLIENNFNLLISLDGGLESNNIYRKFPNQKPAFKIIYKNVLAIKNKYPEYFDKYVNFNSVLHNKNSFTEVYNFFMSNFNKTPLITSLDKVSVNQDLIKEFREMSEGENAIIHKEKDYNSIEKKHQIRIDEDLKKFIIAYSGYIKSGYLELISDEKNVSKIPTGTCTPFSTKVFVTAMGQILPCERIGHQFALGYANKNNVSLDFDKIAKKYNEYFDNINNQCDNCYLKNSCGICMFKENIESKDIQCSGFMNYSAIAEIFSQNISYIEQDSEIYSNVLHKINVI